MKKIALQTAIALVLASQSAYAGSFEDALSAAYESNPRIQAQRDRLESTDESVDQATAGFRPTVSADLDHGRQRTSFDNSPKDNENYTDKTLSLTQPLFRGGGTFAALNSARQRVKAGQYDLAALEQQVLLDAVNAYMDVVSDSSILDLSHKNEQAFSDQLNSVNIRFKVGEVTRTDVAQAESRLLDAKSATYNAENNLLDAISAFERVIGYRPEGFFEMPDKLPALPLSLEEARERGRNANPQLLSAIHTAKSATYDVKQNEAVILPTVNLVGSLARQDGTGATGVDKFDQDRIGVELHIPLYQGGGEYSRVRAAKDTARARDQDATNTRQTIDEQIMQSWSQLQTAGSTITSRNDQIKAAQDALEGLKKEYQYGTRELRDVLDGEQELFNAQTNLVRAERDRIVAGYTLSFRLGELTPANLGLKAAQYDPKIHAKDTEWKIIGL